MIYTLVTIEENDKNSVPSYSVKVKELYQHDVTPQAVIVAISEHDTVLITKDFVDYYHEIFKLVK
jgi:hypothetical protein